jgi:replicative DNA helicase
MVPPLSSHLATGLVLRTLETMEVSDEDSDHSEEASNEVNDETNNSPSHNMIDVLADTYESTNESESNDGKIGVITKFNSEPYTNLFQCLLTYCCLLLLHLH